MFALLEHSFLVLPMCKRQHGSEPETKVGVEREGRAGGGQRDNSQCVSFFFLFVFVNGGSSEEKQTNGVFETTHKTEFWATCL